MGSLQDPQAGQLGKPKFSSLSLILLESMYTGWFPETEQYDGEFLFQNMNTWMACRGRDMRIIFLSSYGSSIFRFVSLPLWAILVKEGYCRARPTTKIELQITSNTGCSLSQWWNAFLPSPAVWPEGRSGRSGRSAGRLISSWTGLELVYGQAFDKQSIMLRS